MWVSAYVEDGGERGREEGVSVLGSLWVSQVLSGRESGRYLIVIASMERTEAGPVRKFLIYLVFLFSLLFLPSPTTPVCGVEESERRCGGLVRTLGANGERGWDPWMTLKGGKTLCPPRPSLVSVPRHIISTHHHLHSAPHLTHSIYPHLSKMKNPSFSSNVQPNIIYTPFSKIESYLGATGFAICF